ncbi:uncharacterized protein, gamma-carboxymuconolactone decarboxylase subunit like protein [Saccharomonospora marina XMU15]|uniref:Uncharacterized protein, gamma-carboxymuconolactone decarboxylase subunit like protein n=1 Tax=Saccharomonospora marina XMU15 TaxID=882083 RepID=H5WWE9_9PSEU|nr:carboxymuconolactone decarboxylase family protein [Saccharomonospora marina]EHR49433.1 uncharacterized protein, gamma-carboxymuconolactone decarboxylase subunit like protein [Saccharomonospora marina XMU15]
MTEQQTGDRYSRGLDILRRVAGVDRPAVLDSLADICPDLGRYTVEFPYGDVYARPALTLRQRQLTTVAALTALGHATPQLRFHIDGALNVGCNRREIVETIVHVVVYAGFPAALNAMTVAKEVFSQRADGSGDDLGGQPQDARESRYERGWKALSQIDGEAGHAVLAGLRDIAPDLGHYIIEFSFGDIYSRQGLDLRTRELVTIAACTALGTARPQLKVHTHGLLNVGGTREEVVEAILQMAVYAGFPAALNGMAAAREVFAERD